MKKNLSTEIYCSVEVFGVDEMIEQIKKIETEIEKLNEMKVEAVVSLPKIKANPKYTLTETEKHIVLAIDNRWKWLTRSAFGYLELTSEKPIKTSLGWGDVFAKRAFDMFHHLFQFIKRSDPEPVSLDELRQIAKGETK